MTKKTTPPTFADTLSQLETLTARLEDNDTSLEQSLQDFEQGVQLIRQAQQALQEAEQKVNLLMAKDGEPVTAPFNESEAGNETE
ncbi:exodeoxyribonuclease VII small subunit [Kineobactrum sediminis]|uniref:Exodeoxyribonuclease 7 small subunit n=1 Tax=Kineobactrum sediminis TaxID=1905677 RepID=A0A2N5Y033_9GAMM|nr:exodeoxyribonuclease VII small subunit [Kineobactrum sediminis]PLW81733.1 exodeoxyribonuclease VII small subunit [Kineobactrum sediminis]